MPGVLPAGGGSGRGVGPPGVLRGHGGGTAGPGPPAVSCSGQQEQGGKGELWRPPPKRCRGRVGPQRNPVGGGRGPSPGGWPGAAGAAPAPLRPLGGRAPPPPCHRLPPARPCRWAPGVPPCPRRASVSPAVAVAARRSLSPAPRRQLLPVPGGRGAGEERGWGGHHVHPQLRGGDGEGAPGLARRRHQPLGHPRQLVPRRWGTPTPRTHRGRAPCPGPGRVRGGRPSPPPFLLHPGRSKSFRLKLPALLALTASKQSLPQEPPDAVIVDFSKHSSESAPEEATSSLENSCLGCSQPEDQKALMDPEEGDGRPEPPVTQSSPRAERLHLHAAFSNCSLARSRSRESCHSIRRASSVDDIETMKGEGDKRCHNRHATAGASMHRGSSTGTWAPGASRWPWCCGWGVGAAGGLPCASLPRSCRKGGFRPTTQAACGPGVKSLGLAAR
ncbi:Potassium voltage-gated channel subfamily H member 2-like protein [Aix galericulata]|nr:Potassium voltage-gated channel subfamily H member 2-like protein [Aix galericulata]